MKCSINWRDRLPIAKWLPHYSLRYLLCDIIAGVTVGLMVIPQGLAYAGIAGLPPQYGLYSAFMGSFVYCLFGSSKDISIGPTAIMSLMVAQYGSKDDPVNFALALSFFCGLIWLIMGLLSLGFIVRLIPIPVISGFTSSAAIIIACGQLKSLLGLDNIPRDFFPGIIKVFKNIRKTNVWDLTLGIGCMILLEFVRSFNKIKWPAEEESPPTRCQRVSRKIIWLVQVGRNALLVFISALVVMAFYAEDDQPFSLTGKVQEGLPPFRFPKLKAHENNRTLSTLDMISYVGDGFIVVPLIGLLEDIAIAQAFARRNHYNVDATQELVALGVGNILGSFISAYPVTGSFSRTSVNAISGVQTQLGGVFTGCVVLLALSVLTPLFKYIPKASLAAVIIVSVLRMVDFKIITKVWSTNKIDILPLVVTFFACFYELDIGILCGIVVALIIVLFRHFVPRIEIRAQQMCLVKFNGGLSYMGIEHVLFKIRETAIFSDIKPESVVIDCSSMSDCDFTVTQGFQQIVQDCQEHGINVVFFKVRHKVKDMLVHSGLSLSLFKDVLDGEYAGLLVQTEDPCTPSTSSTGQTSLIT